MPSDSSVWHRQTKFSPSLSDIEALWKLKHSRNLADNNSFGRLRVKKKDTIYITDLLDSRDREIICVTRLLQNCHRGNSFFYILWKKSRICVRLLSMQRWFLGEICKFAEKSILNKYGSCKEKGIILKEQFSVYNYELIK